MTFSPLSTAFALAPRLPLRAVMRLAPVGAGVLARRGGEPIERLRANMTRLTGREPSPEELTAAVRSHIRNYAEELMLGSRRGCSLLAGVTFEGFDELVRASVDGPVVLALGHSGSWDRAGAWVCANGRTIVTVAEKVEPPSLFARFVALREGLGMEVIGVGKGDSVFSALVERVRARSVIVPLLADRDISGSGIENESATGADVRVRCVGPVTVPDELGAGVNRVEALTAAWVREFAAMMADKPQDWHMMQRVFVEDLDPQRLARARAQHERKNR